MAESLQNYLPTNKSDSKGREIGFIVILGDALVTDYQPLAFFAVVKNARKVNGGFEGFGASQRTYYFATQEEATTWAYKTARARIAKLK